MQGASTYLVNTVTSITILWLHLDDWARTLDIDSLQPPLDVLIQCEKRRMLIRDKETSAHYLDLVFYMRMVLLL